MSDLHDGLHDLLHDAVADVEPADRLAEIRERTAAPARVARPWFYAAGATVLATAAAVATFAVVVDDRPAEDAGPADHHAEESVLVPAYFIGATPRGDRLFREWDEMPGDDLLQAALDRIQTAPSDPDYETGWPQGAFDTAEVRDGVIQVEGGAVDVDTNALAAQQLVYTLQGAVGQRLPVQLLRDGEPVGDLLEAESQNDVLSPVSISDPVELREVSGSFTARGVANSFEATVPWHVLDGDRVVAEGFATAEGSGDRLYEWEDAVDVSGLEPGTYTFVAMTDDPSGGAEGSGPVTDTRTIVVR
jgi:hypothetical protein